jgi:NitT/TauT family transport system permease protein
VTVATGSQGLPPSGSAAAALVARDSRWRVAAAQILVLLLVFGLWEWAVAAGWIAAGKAGQPSRIFALFIDSVASGELSRHLYVTLYEEFLGFAIGVGGGTAVGWGLWWSRSLSRILEPFAVIFNGIPKIALAPPMIVWFGIFETSKVVLAATICFVVAWLSAYAGTRQVDHDLLDMLKAMGASKWQRFVKIVIPASMPWVISAIKINIGFALVGAVVGEFVASNRGLGYLAVQAAIQFQMDRLWMIVFVIMLVAAAQYWMVLWTERRLLAWMGEDGLRAVA